MLEELINEAITRTLDFIRYLEDSVEDLSDLNINFETKNFSKEDIIQLLNYLKLDVKEFTRDLCDDYKEIIETYNKQ